MLTQALLFATRIHDGQTDKLGEPYILHPIAVMQMMRTELTRVIALLHDVVEDSDVTVDSIRAEFGATVAEAVDALTHRKGESNVDYWERAAENSLARTVKEADIRHNLSRLYAISNYTLFTRLNNKYRKALAAILKPRP